MIYRRGVLPVVVLLVLVVVGGVLQIVAGSGAANPSRRAAPSATPTPAAAARAVLSSLAAVERAYDAGDVRRLCRPAVLVDEAVIREQNARQGCESEVQSLMANVPRLRVTVSRLALQPDLATVTIKTGATVDFLRHGQRWLLSFSDGADPLPALAGTA